MTRVRVVLRKVSQITIYINTSYLVKSVKFCGAGWVEVAGRDVGSRAEPAGPNHASPENTQRVTPLYYVI